MPQTSDVASRIFIAPDVLDAPTCRRVQAAMDAGTPEEAEVLDEGFALQEDVRRATQIDVADTGTDDAGDDARCDACSDRLVLRSHAAVT